MVVVHFPLTLDFTTEGEQAQGLSQFIEVKEFRFVRRGECWPFGQISPGKCQRIGTATSQGRT
jgi:hypothetical protein